MRSMPLGSLDLTGRRLWFEYLWITPALEILMLDVGLQGLPL